MLIMRLEDFDDITTTNRLDDFSLPTAAHATLKNGLCAKRRWVDTGQS